MRLSYDVTAVPGHPVGAGRYTIDLARALVERDGVEVHMWCRRSDAGRWEPMSGSGAVVHADAPTARPARLMWEQLALPRLIGKERVDVHHGPHYTMPRFARVPMVVTVHDLTFFDHPEWHERPKVAFFRRAIRTAARRADAIVCVSRMTAELLEERLDPRGQVFVVPHGVDHERFRPDEPSPGSDAAELARYGVHDRYILFLGTIEPRKAVPDLVHAFSRLRQSQNQNQRQHDDLTLVIAGGSGWGSDDVGRAIAETATAASVKRLGYVADSAVPALLRGAAVIAYPARQEGFGLPALEAMACGTPLVTTSGTVMAEMAAGGALLVEPGDVDALAGALEESLERGPAVEARRRAGIEAAVQYTWARSAQGHYDAYQSVVRSGRT